MHNHGVATNQRGPELEAIKMEQRMEAPAARGVSPFLEDAS